jgi:NodT family efflux transporter outer membrane factor (OMF) lipoprotein
MKRIGGLGGVLVMTALLAGCITVGPNYHLPKAATINAPAARGPFVGAASNPAVVQDPLPSHWWRLYQSPELDRLVTEALKSNTDLRVAEANLRRSRAMVALTKTARQPSVGLDSTVLGAQLSAQQYLDPNNVPFYGIYDINLAASYEVDLFGRIRRAVEAANADDEAVEAARDWVRVSVAADVVQAYVEVCADGDELATARASLDLQQRDVVLIQRLMEGGRATSLDLTRSRALTDQFRASIPTLEARRRNALYRLAVLAGRPPAEFEPDLASCAAEPPITRPIPVGDGAALLRRRPDVRAAERELAASTAEIGVATAELYPKVVLGAEVGSFGIVQDFLAKSTNDYGAGPGITWELNQSRARARIAAAKAAQQAQLARFDGVVLEALRDVESALNTYAHDLDRQKSLTAARDEAANALADASRLEAAGRSTSLATLDAQRTLASAESALAAARAQIAQDQVALFLALGGGWEEEKV